MIYDLDRRRARPGARSWCPACGGEITAKCGELVVWHWAHMARDCDPWSQSETAWHLGWKDAFERGGAKTEVVMPPHRADVVTATGIVVELQSGYLDASQIAAREDFYGERLSWLYRCTWSDRLHWGDRGFWWKHGAKSMTTHRRPVWWHVGDSVIRVRLARIQQPNGSDRVVGRILQSKPSMVPA